MLLPLMLFISPLAPEFDSSASLVSPIFSQSSQLDDAALAANAGGAAPLTLGALRRSVDQHSQDDFRAVGNVGATQMEVWWGTTGSEMIAESVRNSLGG